MRHALVHSCTGRQRAFTLLEVLVALAVLALGMGTVLKVTVGQSDQLAYLRDKTIALWIAENKVNEIRLAGWPATGTRSGHTLMAKKEWRWEIRVSNTADAELRRLDVSVNSADTSGEPLLRFIAFSAKKTREVTP